MTFAAQSEESGSSGCMEEVTQNFTVGKKVKRQATKAAPRFAAEEEEGDFNEDEASSDGMEEVT